MAGWVVDPSTSPYLPTDTQPTVFTPASGTTYYYLERSGVSAPPAGVQLFASWDEANNVAQAFNGNGLAQDGTWGVSTPQVA